MTRPRQSLDKDYFDRLYLADPDPWKFATSDYEHAKYDATLRALPSARYSRAMEVGCSIGILTQRIASRCDSVLAIDISEIPLRMAAARCARQSNIDFRQMRFPQQTPAGSFDLIIFSEILYYFAEHDLQASAEYVNRAITPHGDIVLVHWTGETNYPLTADEAVVKFIRLIGAPFAALASHRTADYCLIVIRKNGSSWNPEGNNNA